MPRALKDRQLLEAELTLVRHELATTRRNVEVMQASAETLEPLLAGEVSPAPMSGRVLDPSSRRDLLYEGERAEDVFWTPRLGNPPSLDPYDLASRSRRAEGIYLTLFWAPGRNVSTVRGGEDWAIPQELADLAAETA